jgi:hypothetical protein
MRGLAGRFIESRSGSFAPILFVIMIPLITAVGFSVDYTSAVQTRATEQAALDAGVLAITTMDTASTKAQRQVVLQDSYVANGGQGTATLNTFTVTANGTANAQATAGFDMPTTFMKIARITSVPIGVASAVNKAPGLVEATFKIDKVSGYWNKTMKLYGRTFTGTQDKSLMQIDYVYSNYQYNYTSGGKNYSLGEPKGYGTSTVYTVDSSGNKTQVQKQVCTTTTVANAASVPVGAIPGTAKDVKGNTIYFSTACVTTNTPATGSGAVIDVSTMNKLVLQMSVPSGSPSTLTSNDPTTSNRLYMGLTPTLMPEVETGKTVDIFSDIPCGETGYQAWEDGGNAVPAPVSNADFFYNVTGKCDFTKRPSETTLTQ